MDKNELHNLIKLQVKMGISTHKKTGNVQHIVYPASIQKDLLEVINKSIEEDKNIFIGFQIFGSIPK